MEKTRVSRIRITQNWENDGMLVWKNAQTIDLYDSLRRAFHAKLKGFGCEIFYGLSGGCGVCATQESVDAIIKQCNGIRGRIVEECDPQEVYYYEYNNHESYIAFGGDRGAIAKIMFLFGDNVARQIKRYRDFYTIDEIKEGMKA